MDSITLFRDLRACVSRALRHALKQILRARSDPDTSRGAALDIYASSGYLLRASSAFVGSLSDYIERRALLDEADQSVAGRKLRRTAEYFSDAIDTFISSVAAFASDAAGAPTAGELPDGSLLEGHGRLNGQLVRALYEGTPALDRFRVILQEARQHHEVLRHTVVDLRKQIRLTFGAAEPA